MTTPVAGVTAAPLYGGQNGYLRKPLGAPTSVPTGIPAFRGRSNEPTNPIAAPAIRNSYNRNNRGTNVVIPYPRIVQLDELRASGRLGKGDVAFTSTVNTTGFGSTSCAQLYGIDAMNRELGGHPHHHCKEIEGKLESPFEENWAMGKNVLLLKEDGEFDWTECDMLCKWRVDGIVLSNDEPECFQSSGVHDSQLFNIGIQGTVNVANGYCDSHGGGVESDWRQGPGYSDAGQQVLSADQRHTLLPSGNYYNSFSMQMFDRKLRPGSDIFVGLIATKHMIGGEAKAVQNYNRFKYVKSDDNVKKIVQRLLTSSGSTEDPGGFSGFVSFHYALFSSEHLFYMDRRVVGSFVGGAVPFKGTERYETGLKMALGITEKKNDPYDKDMNNRLKSQAVSKKRTGHRIDVTTSDRFDSFEGISTFELLNCQGAWRIGKVTDVAATERDKYLSGPVDTANSITVNVALEFLNKTALIKRYVYVDEAAEEERQEVLRIAAKKQKVDIHELDDDYSVWPSVGTKTSRKRPREERPSESSSPSGQASTDGSTPVTEGAQKDLKEPQNALTDSSVARGPQSMDSMDNEGGPTVSTAASADGAVGGSRRRRRTDASLAATMAAAAAPVAAAAPDAAAPAAPAAQAAPAAAPAASAAVEATPMAVDQGSESDNSVATPRRGGRRRSEKSVAPIAAEAQEAPPVMAAPGRTSPFSSLFSTGSPFAGNSLAQISASAISAAAASASRHLKSPSHSPHQSPQVVGAKPASRAVSPASSSSAVSSPAASPAVSGQATTSAPTGAQPVAPPASRGTRRGRGAADASDVFASIFGGAAGPSAPTASGPSAGAAADEAPSPAPSDQSAGSRRVRRSRDGR